MAEDWKKAWQPMVDAIGTDFSDGTEKWGADEVERGAIRDFWSLSNLIARFTTINRWRMNMGILTSSLLTAVFLLG